MFFSNFYPCISLVIKKTSQQVHHWNSSAHVTIPVFANTQPKTPSIGKLLCKGTGQYLVAAPWPSQKYWPVPGWACTKRKLIFQTYISRLLWYTLGVILENLSFLMCYICTVDGFIEILQYWMGSLSYYLTRVLYVPTWCRSSLIGNISKSGGREENRQFLLITGVFFHYNGLLSLVSVAFNIYIYNIYTSKNEERII